MLTELFLNISSSIDLRSSLLNIPSSYFFSSYTTPSSPVTAPILFVLNVILLFILLMLLLFLLLLHLLFLFLFHQGLRFSSDYSQLSLHVYCTTKTFPSPTYIHLLSCYFSYPTSYCSSYCSSYSPSSSASP